MVAIIFSPTVYKSGSDLILVTAYRTKPYVKTLPHLYLRYFIFPSMFQEGILFIQFGEMEESQRGYLWVRRVHMQIYVDSNKRMVTIKTQRN